VRDGVRHHLEPDLQGALQQVDGVSPMLTEFWPMTLPSPSEQGT
jgi:hypothetical protein